MLVNVDVILPFHRCDLYFEQAINSLYASRGISFKTILVDDRVDKTIKIHKLLRRIKNYEIVETSGGVGYGNALNLGSKISQSDVLALFNSDDLMHPDRLRKQIESLETSSVNFTKMTRIDHQNHVRKSLAGELVGQNYHSLFLLLGSYGANASWCMRKEWWAKNAYFDSDNCLDWRIALKSFDHSLVGYISESLYFYRQHRIQSTANKSLGLQEMNVVYLEWQSLMERLNIGSYSYDTFSILAMPWNNLNTVNGQEIFKARQAILNYANNLNTQILKDVKVLIDRRMIFGLRSRSDLITKLRMLKLGQKQILPITRDILQK
jgi:glycosyltransferase involved in cell wall biosynthesis